MTSQLPTGTFVVYVVIYHIGHAFMWSFATLLLAVYVVIYHISGGDQVDTVYEIGNELFIIPG